MHDNSLNFTFPLEYVSFQVSMVSTGRMVQSIPAHAHGRGCYEIHYIRHGSGTVVIDGVPRRVGQNTLYTTGPSILHEQIPDPSDPDNPTPPGTDDDEADAYISVKITINPWTYWTQGVDLH